MAKSNSSTFLGLHQKEHVLVVRRRDEQGSHYLLGGADLGSGGSWMNPTNSCDEWFRRQIEKSPDHYWTTHEYRWHLSHAAGGGLVKLSCGEYDGPLEDLVGTYPENKYISEVCLFSQNDISQHLYETELMPWGQAKMALYSIYGKSHSLPNKHRGDPLRDNIGVIKGTMRIWDRPG